MNKVFKKLIELFGIKNHKTSIDDLRRNIGTSAMAISVVIIAITLSTLLIMHKMYLDAKSVADNQKIISAANVYKSNLAEKISVAASSPIFLDYMRSGDKSREKLYYQFAIEMYRLQTNGIVGMELIDNLTNQVIFKAGRVTQSYAIFNLYFLNNILDAKNGDCLLRWKIFFNLHSLIDDIHAINPDITACQTCVPFDFQAGNEWVNLPVESTSGLYLKLHIKQNSDYIFYVYLFFITISFLVFSSWNWHRLNRLIGMFIKNPIKDLTICLEANDSTNLITNLYEMQYLIDEINSWKARVKKAKEDESAAKISNVVAQFAHDVRSPLATINMIMSDLPDFSPQHKSILTGSVQRISDIANHFLNLYKNPNAVPVATLSKTNVLPLLESIIAEKQYQYRGKANIAFHASGSNDVCAMVNEGDLKRMMSNLINNSIEACAVFCEIKVELICSFDNLLIEITDNGSGIPAELIPKIMKGGVSVGKEGGSGMGLSHAVKKAREWQGELDVRSVVGKGTTITIRLPIAETGRLG